MLELSRCLRIFSRGGVSSCHSSGGHAFRIASLNFAVTNGKTTIVTRFRNSAEEFPPSLFIKVRSPLGRETNRGGTFPEACNCIGVSFVVLSLQKHRFSNGDTRGLELGSEPSQYGEEVGTHQLWHSLCFSIFFVSLTLLLLVYVVFVFVFVFVLLCFACVLVCVFCAFVCVCACACVF